ncbi:DUF4326 domain-containing protein [Streptomyces sp. NPDC054933]
MPARVQRTRTAGEPGMPPGSKYVGRRSRFGNPFTIAQAEELGYSEPRKAVVGAFVEWLGGNRDMWQSDEGDQRRERILDGLPSLRGRDLACWCKPDADCHADELLRLANLSEAELTAWIAKVRARVDRNRTWRGEAPMYASSAA